MIGIDSLGDVRAALESMRPGRKAMVIYPPHIAHSAMTNRIRKEAEKEQERRKARGERVFFSYNRPHLECVIIDKMFRE